MATITDYLKQWGQQLNQGMQGMGPALERGMENPLTHAGLGIYAGSMNGGPGAVPGFLQGMQGFNQVKAQKSAEEDRKLMRELQQGQLGRLKSKDESEEARRRAIIQSLKNNPDMLANNPLARQILMATGDPSELQGIGALGGGGMTPYQQESLNLRREQMQQGREVTPYQQAQIDRWKSQQTEMTPYQQAQVGQWQSENARKEAEAQRGATAARQKSMGSANALDAKFQGATAELDKLSEKLNQFQQSPGFRSVYGPFGKQTEQLVDKTGALVAPAAANALAARDEIMAMGGLSRMMDLKGSGVSLGQVTEAEHKLLQQSFGNLKAAQTEEAAAQRIKELQDNISTVKQRLTQAYQSDRSLYDVQGGEDESRDFQDAQRALQARPDMRDEINRRLMQKYGRGL